MTYYGRWVYRFEEAARQGAEALIIIHETAPASYPWKVNPEDFYCKSKNSPFDGMLLEGNALMQSRKEGN